MKRLLTTTLLAATLVSGMACAADAAIPGLITAAVPKAPILPLWARI